MFERYTEPARRTIFFGRYEASVHASGYIETDHLLLGILREDAGLRALLPSGALDQIRDRITSELPPPTKAVSTSIDLPLSHETKRALAYAAEESERLNQRHIEPGHLLLGLLRLSSSRAATVLNEFGVTLESQRERVLREAPQAPGFRSQSRRPEPDFVQIHAASQQLEPLVRQLDELIWTLADRLDLWSEEDGAHVTKRRGWTRKQALGHLVDWASVHQQWLARALTDPQLIAPGYPAEEWVTAQRYDEFAWQELVDLWVYLNRLLVHVLTRVPDDKLGVSCRIGLDKPVPLSLLVSRYVEHCSDVTAQILTHG